MTNRDRIDSLFYNQNLNDEDLLALISTISEDESELLCERARTVREREYGKKVFIRGLVEFSNICRNDCYYCGIRKSNEKCKRFRLEKDMIVNTAVAGYDMGFRTVVLQSGEDMYFTQDRLCDIVASIKKGHEDMAVTLSVGERSYDEYKAFFDAGADRYLLRHEAAYPLLYEKLHPQSMSLENRKKCLFDLKKIGYQIGAGFMVGVPHQTIRDVVYDLRFMQELKPDMIGIGPFISHAQTPFSGEKNGDLFLTINLLAIIRLLFPKVLLPSTTALATLSKKGRNKGIMAGCNVVMPNLSPDFAKENYSLYDKKAHRGLESCENLDKLCKMIKKTGYEIVVDRGDPSDFVFHKKNIDLL